MSVPATTVAPGATDPPRPELERVIGVGGVAFTSFNCIVGVGIFALPALVASLLGTASILAYGACLVLIALVGLCFAEAGSRVPASGGMYAYAEAASALSRVAFPACSWCLATRWARAPRWRVSFSIR
jgi:amino acid transporter